MQLKLLLLGLATAAIAMPSPADGNNLAVEVRDNNMPAPPADNADDLVLEARAPPTKWQASGGCKTDWGGKCLNQCKKEAKSMGQKCKLGSNIWKDECWLGWSVCTCYCKA